NRTRVALVDESRFGFYLTMSEYTQVESSYNNFSHFTDVLLFDIPTNTFQGLDESFYGIHIPLAIFTSESRVYIKHPGFVDKTPGKVSAPFEPSMWGAIVVAVLILSATLALFQHGFSIQEYKSTNQECVYDTFFIIGGLFCAQGASSTPTQVATRIVFFTATLLAVIVFTAYSSNLIAFLTVRKNVFTIKSIDEMFKKNSSYRVGVVKRSSEFDLLQDSDVPDILKLRKGALKCEKRYLMEIPNVEIVDNMTDALNEVCNSQFALVIMSDYLKAQKTQQQCEMVPMEGFLYTTELSFGLRERSSLQEYFRYQRLPSGSQSGADRRLVRAQTNKLGPESGELVILVGWEYEGW
ncbi:unnamed protein product, partial [Timema podura]|nr:unnamed protein product [Timema podura]